MILDLVAAFGLSLAIDFVYAKWMVSVNEHRTLSAMLWSASCPLLGFASLLVCLDCPWSLAPSCLGHALGTYLSMRRSDD